MPADIILWPHTLLKPAQISPNPSPTTRSGGRTLGGISRNVRTDKGRWVISYKGVALNTEDKRRSWNSIRVNLGGMFGLIAIPVWSMDSLPWPEGTVDGVVLTPHDDSTPHSDGSFYAQPAFNVELVLAAALGATSVTIRTAAGIDDLSGIRFSYEHALYETGEATLVVDDVWSLPIFPSIRAAIPINAVLEVALPTCLVHLATDGEMDVSFTAGKFDLADVSFVEAVDYWNDLATA